MSCGWVSKSWVWDITILVSCRWVSKSWVWDITIIISCGWVSKSSLWDSDINHAIQMSLLAIRVPRRQYIYLYVDEFLGYPYPIATVHMCISYGWVGESPVGGIVGSLHGIGTVNDSQKHGSRAEEASKTTGSGYRYGWRLPAHCWLHCIFGHVQHF